METGVWGFSLGSGGTAPVAVRMPQSLLPFPLQRSESLWMEHVTDFALAVSQLGVNAIVLSVPLSDLAGEDRLSLVQIGSVAAMIRRTAEPILAKGVWLFIEIINSPMPAWLSSTGGIDGVEGRTHLANAMSALADALGPAAGIAAVMPDAGLTQPPMGHDNWATFTSGGSAVRLWKQWRTQTGLSGDDTLPSLKWNPVGSRYEQPQAKVYELQRFRSWLFLQRWSCLTTGAIASNSRLRWGCHLPDGRLGLLPGEALRYGGILGVDMPASCGVSSINLGEYPYDEAGDTAEWTKRSIMMLRMSTKGTQPSLLAEFTTKLTTDAALVGLRANMQLIRGHCAGLIIGNIELAAALTAEFNISSSRKIKRNNPRSFIRLSRQDELAPVKPGRLSELMKSSLVRVQQTDGQWDRS